MGLSLRAMRVNANLTQEQVAKEIGVSLKQYREKETGQVGLWLSEAVKLSELLCQTIEAICMAEKEK